MPRLPIVRRRRSAGVAAALAVLLALPWPRVPGLEPIVDRLLAAWRRVAAVEEPQPSDPAPADPASEPVPEGDKGPSIDPDGNRLGDGDAAPTAGPLP